MDEGEKTGELALKEKTNHRPFRIQSRNIGLPTEWTSGKISDLEEMIAEADLQQRLAKQATVMLEPTGIAAPFQRALEKVHASYLRLLLMEPIDRKLLPKGKLSGVYLFSEGDRHLYVGRTRHLRQRLRNHGGLSSGHNQAVFAFKLAREQAGKKIASYSVKDSRKMLETDPIFSPVFLECKERVCSMDLRFVEEPDPLLQTLLEIYVAASLKTPYNDFETH